MADIDIDLYKEYLGKVTDEIERQIKAQQDKLRKLNPGVSVDMATPTAQFIRKVIEQAFSQLDVQAMIDKTEQFLKTGKSKVARNRSAVV